MKKRGFTLIELLAVIVVLAIIALIATPIIMNVIEKSRKGAAERSAANYMDAVNTTAIRESVKRNEVVDGVYDILSDGSICLQETNCEKTAIKIEMSGDMPSSGTLVIKDQIVIGRSEDGATRFKIKDYTMVYNTSENIWVVLNKNQNQVCRPATEWEVTKGNVPEGNYEYGDEYVCDLGDGVERSFYVLEDGNNTDLDEYAGERHFETTTPGYGTAKDNEVALIMDENIGSDTSWCMKSTGRWVCNTCNANNAKQYLEEQTTNWTTTQITSITLPTYAQIKQANGGLTENLANWTIGKNDKSYWTLTGGTNHIGGMWLDDNECNNNAAYLVSASKEALTTEEVSQNLYLRPVITISKDNLK